MYYAIEISYSLFLLRSFKVFLDVLDVDLSSLFIIRELSHTV
jgi:hypothetical protein